MVRLHKRAIPAMKRLKHETFMVIRNSASGQREIPKPADRRGCARARRSLRAVDRQSFYGGKQMFREITLAGVGPQNLSSARYWRGVPPRGAKLSSGSRSIAL
jgi:hypothetical protein